MLAFGWTWEYVDECMTVPRFNSIQRAWEYAPPVHMLVAGFFGIKRRGPSRDQEALIASLLQCPPEGVVVNGR